MEIELKQLQEVVNKLLDHIIVTRQVDRVTLDSNFYWNVPEDQVYNVEKNPAELDMGSLQDDWELLSTLLKDNTDPVAYQLTEVAPILRKVGEVLGKALAGKGG